MAETVASGTVSVPFIFLKQIGVSEAPARKIYYPKSFAFLLKKAKTMYSSQIEVRSFYNEDGHRVTSLDDLVPGSIVYVSSLDSADVHSGELPPQKEVIIPPPQSPSKDESKIMSKESYQKIFGANFGDKIDQDKLPKDGDSSNIAYPKQAQKDAGESKSKKKSRIRFMPRAERLQKAAEAEAEAKAIADAKADRERLEREREKQEKERQEKERQEQERKEQERKENERLERGMKNGIYDDYDYDYDASNRPNSRRNSAVSSKASSVRGCNNAITDENSERNDMNASNRSKNKPNVTINKGPVPDSHVFEEEEDFEEYDELGESENLQMLFNKILKEGAFRRNIPKAVEDLPDFANSINKLPDLEYSQKCDWFARGLTALEQQNMFPVTSDIFGNDDMIGRARCLMIDHRFVNFGGFTHRLNIGVVGPNKSGKSTFLRIITEELLSDLIATDEWKNTFTFVLDMNFVISYISDFSRFYQSMVESTINCISWQRPHLKPFMEMIKKQFDDIIIYKQPPKFNKVFALNPSTQRIAAELQVIINKLSQLWNNEEALTEWTMMSIYFPILISKALGFQKFIYVIDHFDVGNVKIDPTPAKFSESESSIYFVDILKYVLTQCNFIISCSDQQNFYSILEPNTEEERQCQKQFDIISTIGLIMEPQNDENQIVVETAEMKTPFILTVDICGGIPLYLSIWDEANKILDEMDKDKEEEEEEKRDEAKVEEQNEALFILMQRAIKILFVCDEMVEKYEIINVRRKSAPKQKNE